MTFKFSGDFGKIDRFIRKLRTVKGVVAKVRGMMADFALADITRKANAGLNPYGRAWISGAGKRSHGQGDPTADVI